MATLLLLSTSDTDLLAAKASGADYRLANPARTDPALLPELLRGVDVAVVRLLGGRQAWPEGLDALLGAGVPLVVLGGEALPDATLMAASTVPAGIAASAHDYLAQGGSDNLRELANFLSDTVLFSGAEFAAPVTLPQWAVEPRPALDSEAERPRVAVLYYRAQHLAGNTAFVGTLCEAIEAKGGIATPIWCSTLRSADGDLLATLSEADALVVTVLAAGGTRPATASAGGDDGAWDVSALAALDVPVLQALCLTDSHAAWEESDAGLSPLDVGNQVAIPEFDGRIITVPFSWKEVAADGTSSYVADRERALRVAGIAVAHARLRHLEPAERRIGIVLSAYPTKHSRIGNAVGLDTPASLVRLLNAMREKGYDLGPPEALPGLDPPDGDALIHALIAAGGQDPEWLTEEALAGNPVRIAAADYLAAFAEFPARLRDSMEEHWGEAPGELYVDKTTNPDGDIVLAALRAGNVTILVQPPRGFGENPVAIYHDPELPPSHHYLAAYRWLETPPERGGFGAHALVHVGKHGNLEWLPGKNVGMSAACATDAALGDLPLIYPFLVNDPGEGAQAKRRAHAVIIDHLVPPMARAEAYGDLSRLEQLLDEHANIAALDPPKLPAVRAQIWTLIQAAKLDHDLGLDDRPDDEGFDDFILHLDGWLCEIKDVMIRDGLHTLGVAPAGPARVDLVLAILRARQVWGGQSSLPGLREALGLAEDSPGTAETDRVEAQARSLVEAMELQGWPTEPEEIGRLTDDGTVAEVLRFAATEVVPRLDATVGELDAVLHALDGGYTPAGPSGSPLRGLVNVLPTGRNFYTVDPRAVPSRLAYETGQALAESVVSRFREETGEWPASVGLSIWGTSAMRTSGDDVGELLALLGVRPVWDDASRRVRELAVVPLEELGRPRVDVVARISGFFRDAFPHVVTMMDDAVRLVADLDEPAADNPIRANALAELARHNDWRRATMRIFGSPPGSYGAGLLSVVEARSWRDDADLAEVYAVWGGHAYGRDLDGIPAREDMESNYRRIEVAVKNLDTREHDIADSDDYYQYHGGMVATVKALTGTAPKAYVGDSTTPQHVRTRSLLEESARVYRSRVVNPRWIAAMRRHGYKGAFELAATVDYLFGWDATTGVVADWMYEGLASSYVFDAETREFLETSNPWALRSITERLLEAADRGLWAAPEADTLEGLKATYLQIENDLEEAHA